MHVSQWIDAAPLRTRSARIAAPRANSFQGFRRMPLSFRAASFLVSIIAAGAAQAAVPIPQPPSVEARSYILMDYDSGRVLAESNADQRVEPASITKVMTVYVAFDALKQK